MLRYFPLPLSRNQPQRGKTFRKRPFLPLFFARRSLLFPLLRIARVIYLRLSSSRNSTTSYRLITPTTAQRDVALNATDIYSIRNVAYFSLSLSLSSSSSSSSKKIDGGKVENFYEMLRSILFNYTLVSQPHIHSSHMCERYICTSCT